MKISYTGIAKVILSIGVVLLSTFGKFEAMEMCIGILFLSLVLD
jgi:hypothetical protein